MNILSRVKVGRITYTNIWPVYHFFDLEKFKGKVELISQVPSQLNKHMSEGLIDIGPISSFSYAENADKYVLLPDLSVSAHGTVGSITLFLKTDLNDIANKKVALSNTSTTSINLLKILLEVFVGVKPEYVTMPPDLDMMMNEADAALLIGDEALIAGWENEQRKQYKAIDLGDEWLKRTNHWMTFAVWAVRKEILTKAPELLYEIHQEFLNSKKLGKINKNDIIKESISKYGGTEHFWTQYFKGLSHDFAEEQISGLKHYFQLAYKIGLLKKLPDIDVVDFDKLMLHSSTKVT